MLQENSSVRRFYWLLSFFVVIILLLPAINSTNMGSTSSPGSFEMANNYIVQKPQIDGINSPLDISVRPVPEVTENLDSSEIKEISKESIIINLHLTPDNIEIQQLNGWDFIGISGYDHPDQPGRPALPVRTVRVLVPADARELGIEVLNQEVIVLPGEFRIPGVPEPLPIGVNPGFDQDLIPPVINNEYTLEFAHEGYIRGFRVVSYYFNPIHLTPGGRLEVITQFEFSLNYIHGKLKTSPLPKHSFFWEVLQNTLENPVDMNNFAPLNFKPTGKLTTKDVKYVIVTNTTMVGNGFDELRDWKTKKGVPAEIIEVSWITSNYNGNDTQEQIRNFLKDAMATWGIEYCLLGGDVSVVPYRSCYAEVGGSWIQPDIATDLYYSDLDGNFDADADGTYGETTDNVDCHPDIIVGRAPVESASELTVFINKTLKYAKDPPRNYALNATLAGEYLDANTNSSIAMDKIKNNVLPLRYASTSLFDAGYKVYFNMSKVGFKNVMDAGAGLIFHSGHSNYYVMGMGSPPSGDYAWYNVDAKTLTNGYKLGVLYTLGCITTQFNMDESIAEDHVNNPNGGTVAFIGNSRYGWYSPGSPGSGPSDRYMYRMAEEIFKYGNVRVGENFAAGKDYFVGWSGGNGSMRWLQFALNLIGEPEMYTWTDLPKTMTVTHPNQVFFGPQTLSVQVNDSISLEPLRNALVCLKSKNVYAYGITDALGKADFQFTLSAHEKINVTVTNHNYLPYEGLINKTIKDTNPPVLGLDTGEFGWFNSDPGNVITVTFDGTGETDLSKGEYSLTPTGPWYSIFTGPHANYMVPWNISAVWSSLPEGLNTIWVRCYDSASPKNWVMNNITVKKDITPPSVTVNTLTYGWYTTDPGAVVDVDFSNDFKGSPLERAEYSINSASGPWYSIFGFTGPLGEFKDNWQVKWFKLEDGVNSIYIRLFDEAGNEDITIDKISFKRDTLPPIVVVRKDTYGWYSTDPGAVIDVDFSNGGNGSNLDYAQYSIGSSGTWHDVFTMDVTEYTPKWSVSWVDLLEGENKIHVRCYDKVGFNVTVINSFKMYIDTTAPHIIINKSVYGWYTSDPGQVVDVDFSNVDSTSSLLDYAQYRVHPEPGMGSTGPWRNIFSSDLAEFSVNWQVFWKDLKEGNNTIEVQVYDLASNKKSTIDTIYFLKDTTAPEILVTTKEYGWYSSDPGSVIDLDFDNKGKGSDLDFAEYRVGGGLWQKICQINDGSYSSDWCVDWSTLTEGENDVEVRLWDLAGFSAIQDIKIFKDTQPPVIKINKPEYGWFGSDPGAAIDVDFICANNYINGQKDCSLLNFSEYKIGKDGAWLRIHDTVTPNYTAPWAIAWSALDDGISEIYLRTQDEAGNIFESPYYIKFKKDTTPPSIVINEKNYGWLNSDPGNIIDVDFSHLPGATGYNPAEHSNLIGAQYKINSDGKWINIFTKECDTFALPWNVSWALLDQGENTIYLRAIDSVGNIFFNPAVNISILKDIETPVIIFNKPSFGWYNSDPGAVIDVDFDAGLLYSGYDKNSPLKKAQYMIGAYGKWNEIFLIQDPLKNQIYNFNINWSITWELAQEGSNNVFIRLYDTAGNVNESEMYIVFQRDTVGPLPPQLITPKDASKTTDTTPQHRWSEPSEPGSNIIQKYRIQVNNIGSFSDNLIDEVTTKLTFMHTHVLPVGIYYWRVQGIDIAGNVGSWSETWRFEVVEQTSTEANFPPIAEAGEDIVAGVGEMVWFDGLSSSDPENDPISYLWYLDNDPTLDAEGVLVYWVYLEAGEYQVTLEIFDDHGGSDSDSLVVTVLDTSMDSDNDSIPDAWELYFGLDPLDPSDAVEDSDKDGYMNSLEYSKGSSILNSLSTPSSVSDDVAPEIVHTKIESGKLYNAIEIKAIVTDKDSGIKAVNLYYKKKSETRYNTITMGHENPYSATIPGSMATLDDIEYYIEAVDNAKTPNIVYYGKTGMILSRPIKTNDIDIDIRKDYQTPEDSNILDNFMDAFDFGSFGVCLIVLIVLLILIISFLLSLHSASRARQMAAMQKYRRTIHVMRGKNMRWEGFESENIDEDEDLNLLDDEFAIDQV